LYEYAVGTALAVSETLSPGQMSPGNTSRANTGFGGGALTGINILIPDSVAVTVLGHDVKGSKIVAVIDFAPSEVHSTTTKEVLVFVDRNTPPTTDQFAVHGL
jgi:uncharacterized spore protein YtfJ